MHASNLGAVGILSHSLPRAVVSERSLGFVFDLIPVALELNPTPCRGARVVPAERIDQGIEKIPGEACLLGIGV